MGSVRRPTHASSSDTATSSGEDSDAPVGRPEHWKLRHTGVLVETAWAAAATKVERALWSELVARAVSELDVEAATEHARAGAAAAASLPPSQEARDARLVTRVVGRYDASDEDGGGRGASSGGSDSDSGQHVRRKGKTASELYRGSKARSIADAELLRPRVPPERTQPQGGRENREGAVSAALGASAAQLPHRPRGWPREWSSSWAKVHHRRRHHAPAALQPAALLAQDTDLT